LIYFIDNNNKSMSEYTIDEVSQHNTELDAWIIINDNVYDITDFIDEHPGGKQILMTVIGGDATEFFEELHHPNILKEYGNNFKIGVLIE